MNDTTPEMGKLQRELVMALSPAERLRIGCSMFEASRAMVLASFGDISETEKRVQLFLRFYGNDFDDTMKAKIIATIREDGDRELAS